MFNMLVGALAALALAWPAAAQVTPFPGDFRTQEITTDDGATIHLRAGGPDAERLVAGYERIYLDRFWNEFAGDPAKIDEPTRVHYAQLYARPGAMRSASTTCNRRSSPPALVTYCTASRSASSARVEKSVGTRIRVITIPPASLPCVPGPPRRSSFG